MLILNGHKPVSLDDFLGTEYLENVFKEGDDIPSRLNHDIYEEGSEGKEHSWDFWTPLDKGKEWLFELTCKHQPRTGKLLMEGGPLLLRQVHGVYNKSSYSIHLCLEVLGKVILIERDFWGRNLSDPGYRHIRGLDHLMSLPVEIREAYYTRFDGLNIPGDPWMSINTYLLPRPSGKWNIVDSYLEQFKGAKKKYLPWFDEHFPQLRPKADQDVHYGFRCILSTEAFFDPYGPDKKAPKYPRDALFIKHDPKDGIIYHVEDGKLDEMQILQDPVEVIDKYCEHVLLNKCDRFDFRQYTSPLS